MELHLEPIIGHESSRQKALQHFAKAGHHTLMLEGPKGIGKSCFAGQLSDAILAESTQLDGQIRPDPTHPSTRLLMNGGHPDFLLIKATQFGLKSGQIPTEALDHIHRFAQRKGASKRRIVLIDALDDCVLSLSHGLLKLLEEPPEGVVFILIVHQIGRILDTIRSRTSRINFAPLSVDEMRECLPNLPLGENPPETETLIALSEGAPGRAVTLIGADIDGLLQKCSNYLNDSASNGNSARELLQYICLKKHQHFQAWKHIHLWLCQQILRQSVLRQDQIPIKSAEGIFAAFHRNIRGDSLLQEIHETIAMLHKIQQPPAYLDAEQTLQSILLRWHRLIHQS